MKVYLDLVMILNFFFDFLLLLSVSLLLRRNVSIYRIMFGAFLGGISLLFLFLPLNNITLFCFKIAVSILMIIASFGFRDIRYTFKNFLYLYSASIILGGFLYFLNVQFAYKQEGMMFIYQGLSINVIFLIIFCPIILYIYVKQGLWLKNHYHHYYKVNMMLDNNKYYFNAFLDTGNQLVDIYSHKPIVLIDKEIKTDYFFYVPYRGASGDGILKCIKMDKIIIDKKEYEDVIVGILQQKIQMDGIDCLLNSKLWEEI